MVNSEISVIHLSSRANQICAQYILAAEMLWYVVTLRNTALLHYQNDWIIRGNGFKSIVPPWAKGSPAPPGRAAPCHQRRTLLCWLVLAPPSPTGAAWWSRARPASCSLRPRWTGRWCCERAKSPRVIWLEAPPAWRHSLLRHRYHLNRITEVRLVFTFPLKL